MAATRPKEFRMALRNRQPTLLLPMRIWDLPIRIFHWSIVVLLPCSYISMRLNMMDLHMALGYAVLALVLFRWVWGVIGSDTARFGRFLRSPASVVRHLLRLRVREPDTELGHNAAGGWVVLLLLLLLTVQVGAGLCANDGGATEGPLAKYVGQAWSDRLSLVHAVTFNLILAAIALHVAAVVAYAAVKRQNLLRPMITGKKRLPAALQAPRMASPILALAVLLAAAALSAFVATRL
jgi:cytochrome b